MTHCQMIDQLGYEENCDVVAQRDGLMGEVGLSQTQYM